MATAIHCDSPTCNTWQKDHQPRRLTDTGWLHIQHIDDHSEIWHFCSWDCVLKYAATKTPTTEIDL